MKSIILEIKPNNKKKCINKDLAGGMGTGTWVGDSFLARVFEYVKRNSVILPNITNAYLAAIFKKYGWEVEFREIREAGEFKGKADLVLVHTSIVDCNHELEIVKELKRIGLKIGVFGSFASAVPEFFADNADFVIKGEPEAGLEKILASGKIPVGIFEAGLIENINFLLFPDWSLFPIKKYSYFPALYKKPVLTMLASRGCPYSCAYYCPYTLLAGRNWRGRSAENVIEEMVYLIKNYRIKAIDFRDAIFTLDRERTIDLCQRIINKKIRIIWSCETRLDKLDEDLISIMNKAGLRHLNVGIESFSSEILKEQKRLPINMEYQEKIIKFCHNNSISVAAFYIIGMENDTLESVNQTIDYAKKLNTLVAQFAISTPYPGTKYFREMKASGRLIDTAWKNFDEYTPVIKHKNLSAEEILNLKEKAFVSYYFDKKYLSKHLPKIIKNKILCLF